MSSSRKNYNSIVFLTTLSLYLGLVLAGGSAVPTVLAQAATTRNFDIKSEIVVEDDLDKKPDEEEIDASGSIKNYFGNIEKLVSGLKKLHQAEKINFDYDTFELKELLLFPCGVESAPVHVVYSEGYLGKQFSPVFEDAVLNLQALYSLSDCHVLDKDKDGFSTRNEFINSRAGVSKSSDYNFGFDKSELKIAVAVFKSTPQRAEQLAAKFNQAAKIYKVDEAKSIVKKIHENTSFKSENNQVFIVTRLPRASIDDLVAQK